MVDPKPYSPLTLQQRIDSYADQAKVAKARAEQDTKDMLAAYDQLMVAEAEVHNKTHGWEGVTLSGLVPEGKNKYIGGEESEPDFAAAAPPPPAEPKPPPAPLEELSDPKPI